MAITTRLDTSTYNVFLKEGILRKEFNDTQGKVEIFWPKFSNRIATKDAWELDQQTADLTGFTELREGQNIPALSPVMGAQKKTEIRRFGAGFRMTDKMIKFNKRSLWNRYTKSLSRAMKQGMDIEIHVPFNSPTSTSLTCGTGFDTMAIANTAHTGLLAGSTADNYNNYAAAALSYTSLETARYYFKTKKDSLGNLASMVPDTLMFEPTLDPTVHELFKSDYKAYENSNTDNFYKSMGLTMISNPRLSSTTTWFMLAKGSDLYDYNVYIAYEPDFLTADAPDTSRDRMATSQCYFAYSWGWPGAIFTGRT